MTKKSHLLARLLRVCISAVYLACVTLTKTLTKILRRPPTSTCVVLYYHSIAAEERVKFARQMDTVKRLTTPINPENEPRLSPGKYYSAITFDDGFQDAIDNAVPELICREVPALFFVTTGAIGRPASWWPTTSVEHSRNIASAEAFRAVASEWIRIGAHTVTHPHLSTLEELDARREISESRQYLRSLLGCEVRSFSFPYGDFNETIAKWCVEAGYERAFTSEHKNAFANGSAFLVGRVKAEPSDWSVEFYLKLLGGYAWLPRAIALKRLLLKSQIGGNLHQHITSALRDRSSQG